MKGDLLVDQSDKKRNFYRLIQGDCLEVLPKMPNQNVDLIICDPPYNIGKDYWDKIESYYEWLLSIFQQLERTLKPNGTLWLFHMVFPVMGKINTIIEEKTSFRFKQLIIINKGLQSIAGRTSDKLQCYPRATEYLVFYTFENPMAKYLKREFTRAQVTFKEIAEAGHFYGKINHSGSVSNWVLGLNLPSKEQYEKIRNYLNRSNDNNYLKEQYENLRYRFNLEQGLTDVWDISFYKNVDKTHPTTKPVDLMKRIVSTASNINDVVLDPFCGSGSTIEACQDLKRSCIAIEVSPEYCEIAKKRCFGRKFLDRAVEYKFEVFEA